MFIFNSKYYNIYFIVELSLHTFAKIAIVTVGVLVMTVTVVILVICLVLKDHVKRTWVLKTHFITLSIVFIRWSVTSSDIKTNKQQVRALHTIHHIPLQFVHYVNNTISVLFIFVICFWSQLEQILLPISTI